MSEPARAVQINIRPAAGTRTVRAGGALIARSDRALELIEGNYLPVLYFPREEVAMDLLDRSTRASTCPHKGQASYFSITTPSGRLEDSVWSYEAPRPHVGAIAGYLAFYADRVTIAEG